MRACITVIHSEFTMHEDGTYTFHISHIVTFGKPNLLHTHQLPCTPTLLSPRPLGCCQPRLVLLTAAPPATLYGSHVACCCCCCCCSWLRYLWHCCCRCWRGRLRGPWCRRCAPCCCQSCCGLRVTGPTPRLHSLVQVGQKCTLTAPARRSKAQQGTHWHWPCTLARAGRGGGHRLESGGLHSARRRRRTAQVRQAWCM